MPLGTLCCDNCNPDEFPVDVIHVIDPSDLKKGRSPVSTDDFEADVCDRLLSLAQFIVKCDYPNQCFFTAHHLITPTIIDIIAKYATGIKTVDKLNKNVRWFNSRDYGAEFVDVINEYMLSTLLMRTIMRRRMKTWM